jgi:hypothetical protein
VHALDAEKPKLRQRIGGDTHAVAFVRRIMLAPFFRIGRKCQF